MLKRKCLLMAACVLAGGPLIARAVTITYSYDANDILVNGSPVSLGGAASAPTLSVPWFAVVTIGVDVTVTGNPNSPLAYHGVYDSTPGPQQFLQPQNLGLAGFAFGFTSSNYSLGSFSVSNVTVNSGFSSERETGMLGSDGSVQSGSIAGLVLASSVDASTRAGATTVGYGANPGPGELFNGLQIDASVFSVPFVITPTAVNASSVYFEYSSGGTSSASVPVYTTAIAQAS